MLYKQEAPEITERALNGSDSVAVESVDMFLAILGQEAGANSLRVLAQGGVYLCGGILPRVRILAAAVSFLSACLLSLQPLACSQCRKMCQHQQAHFCDEDKAFSILAPNVCLMCVLQIGCMV